MPSQTPEIIDLTIPMLMPYDGDRFLNVCAFPDRSVRNNKLVCWLGPNLWSQLVYPYLAGEVNPQVMNKRLLEISGYYNQWLAHTESTRLSLLKLPNYLRVE